MRIAIDNDAVEYDRSLRARIFCEKAANWRRSSIFYGYPRPRGRARDALLDSSVPDDKVATDQWPISFVAACAGAASYHLMSLAYPLSAAGCSYSRMHPAHYWDAAKLASAEARYTQAGLFLQ